jgi:signal transduction histidine kinase
MNISQNIALVASGFAAGMTVAAAAYYGGIKSALKASVARELGKKQDQFISIASHYMLSPITIIQVAMSQLKERDAELKPEQRLKFYDAIERGQQRLWILAEQFLIVGEVDHNRLQLQVGVNNVVDTVRAAVLSMKSFSDQKKIKVSVIDQSGNLQQIRYDARRVKQALIAVLDNAIKFGPEGSEIVVQIVYQSSIFSIVIQDQGIGMPKEVMEHVSERFYRGTQLYNFDYEGLGLGLHIAYAIIMLHQGSLSFQSKPGKGTTALIQLPGI